MFFFVVAILMKSPRFCFFSSNFHLTFTEMFYSGAYSAGLICIAGFMTWNIEATIIFELSLTATYTHGVYAQLIIQKVTSSKSESLLKSFRITTALSKWFKPMSRHD